jgi:hypothetical protein
LCSSVFSKETRYWRHWALQSIGQISRFRRLKAVARHPPCEPIQTSTSSYTVTQNSGGTSPESPTKNPRFKNKEVVKDVQPLHTTTVTIVLLKLDLL